MVRAGASIAVLAGCMLSPEGICAPATAGAVVMPCHVPSPAPAGASRTCRIWPGRRPARTAEARDLIPAGGRECDTGLAESFASGLRADPGFRRACGAGAGDRAGVHHPGSAGRTGRGVAERGAGRHVSALNGQVIKHAAIVTADPATTSGRRQDPRSPGMADRRSGPGLAGWAGAMPICAARQIARNDALSQPQTSDTGNGAHQRSSCAGRG